MIICVCKAVNDRAIRRAVAEGHDTFDALQFELGVGTCCGKCVPSACEVLCEARSALCGQAPSHADMPVRLTSRPAPRPVHLEVALA
jgi:bacterioferritin-associated ferredoxin